MRVDKSRGASDGRFGDPFDNDDAPHSIMGAQLLHRRRMISSHGMFRVLDLRGALTVIGWAGIGSKLRQRLVRSFSEKRSVVA